jgi:hypothetical protein
MESIRIHRVGVSIGTHFICDDSPLETKRLGQRECQDYCAAIEECKYILFDEEDGQCSIFSSCNLIKGGTESNRQAFKMIDLPAFAACSAFKIQLEDCLEILHRRAGLGHDHMDSVHWLARVARARGDLSSTYLWAQRSASHGEAEGIYYLGELSRDGWDGNAPNISRAKELFWKLLLQPVDDPESGGQNGGSHFDDEELATIQDIACQLGIHEHGVGEIDTKSLSSIPHRLAGIVGLVSTYWQEYSQARLNLATILTLSLLFITNLVRRLLV